MAVALKTGLAPWIIGKKGGAYCLGENSSRFQVVNTPLLPMRKRQGKRVTAPGVGSGLGRAQAHHRPDLASWSFVMAESLFLRQQACAPSNAIYLHYDITHRMELSALLSLPRPRRVASNWGPGRCPSRIRLERGSTNRLSFIFPSRQIPSIVESWFLISRTWKSRQYEANYRPPSLRLTCPWGHRARTCTQVQPGSSVDSWQPLRTDPRQGHCEQFQETKAQ